MFSLAEQPALQLGKIKNIKQVLRSSSAPAVIIKKKTARREVSLIFGVTLHIRDKEIVQALASYFTLLNSKGLEDLTVKPYTIFVGNFISHKKILSLLCPAAA